MLDRALKLIVTLTLLLFLVQAVISVFARALAALVLSMADAGSFLGVIVAAVLVFTFVVGLFLRTAQFIANWDPRRARERATRDRTARQRVRRPAEGVPPVASHAEVLEDPDPAIGADDGGR